MNTLTRRGFFGRLAAVAAGAVAAVTLKPKHSLAFNSDAFNAVSDGLRYIRQYDLHSGEWVSSYQWNVGPSQIKNLYFSETTDALMTPARFNREILPVLHAEGYRA